MEVKKITPGNLQLLNADLSELIDNWNDSSLYNTKKLVADDRCYYFVAISDNSIVGYALAYKFPSLNFDGGLAYLYDIEVLEMHRKKGIGRKLIENILADLKKDGVTEAWLGTAIDNSAAQTLFTSTGAERTEEIFYDYTYRL